MPVGAFRADQTMGGPFVKPVDQPTQVTARDEMPPMARHVVPPDKLPYHERLRGRAARYPFQIGWRGWWDITIRIAERVGADNLGLITAGVTFYVFLALVPALIAIVSIYGILADSVTLDSHVAFLAGYLPEQSLTWIASEISRVRAFQENGLSVALALSFAIAFWSMNNAVIALFGAMNIAYGETERRWIINLYLRAFAVTITALIGSLGMIAAIVVLPLAVGEGALDYGGRRVTAPAMFTIVALGTAAIYRLGPSRRPAKWRWIAVGAFAVAFTWIAVATLVSWYLSNIANYALIYGSLGTVVALMFWFFISVYTVLLGAKLAAETEHQTMVDTTVGPERPMGRRGAYVADTVGRKAGGSPAVRAGAHDG